MYDADTMYVLTEQEQDVVDGLSTFQLLAYVFYKDKPTSNFWIQDQLKKYAGLSFKIVEMEPVTLRCDEVLGPAPTPSVGTVRVRFEASWGRTLRMHATFVAISKKQFFTLQ
jgi:hypothetical protein